MRLLAATDVCRWCDRPIDGRELQVTLPSGVLVHWSCALIAADRGILEQPTHNQYRMVNGELVSA